MIYIVLDSSDGWRFGRIVPFGHRDALKNLRRLLAEPRMSELPVSIRRF